MFGTSGIRGPVGETITATVALRVGRAVGSRASTVVVGRDVRESGRMLEHAFVAGVLECGASVIRVGIESTPTVARGVNWLGADIGVTITGSHNAAADNGIKLWNRSGQAFTREEYRSTIRRANAGTASYASAANVGDDRRYDDLHQLHRDRLKMSFDAVDDLSVVVDLGNGAGRLTPDILTSLGCSVLTLNAQADGSFPGRETEPTAETCRKLCQTVEATGADFGIAHDADADRMLAVDETGQFVPGDLLLALFARDVVVDGSRVAVPVDTSELVEDVVTAAGGSVIRTRVGDAFVAEAVTDPDVVFGGEPSGTWIWRHETFCPDAHFAACQLATIVDREGPLSTQLRSFDAYETRRRRLSISDTSAAMDRVCRRLNGRYESIDTTDGVRIETDGGWFLIRPSGTEPVVRVTAEARTESAVERLLEEACAAVEATTTVA
ncbi:phosphoglucosamine mutase (plasmid) [Haloferacaceae archaeon DSL9]